jgi:hypothetical protein
MSLANPQSLAIAAAVGFLSGTHTAIWGMYKDAIHEGFGMGRFLRSAVVGALVAAAIQAVLRLPLPEPAAMVVLFGLAYAAERGIVEVWKTFVRDEDQSKYAIPMQFSVHGVPVAGRGVRLAAGVGYVTIVALCLFAIARLEQGAPGLPTTIRTALVGLVVGAIIAFGGAWKDAPTEGFDPVKFFRSPLLTVLFALLVSRLTESYLLVAVAAIGYERASAETWKTFFFPSKPRGKFAGKAIFFPEMLTRRGYLVPVYVAIWVAVVVAGALAMRGSIVAEASAEGAYMGDRP